MSERDVLLAPDQQRGGAVILGQSSSCSRRPSIGRSPYTKRRSASWRTVVRPIAAATKLAGAHGDHPPGGTHFFLQSAVSTEARIAPVSADRSSPPAPPHRRVVAPRGGAIRGLRRPAVPATRAHRQLAPQRRRRL